MRTTITEGSGSQEELARLEAEYKTQVEQINSEIATLEADNQRLIEQMHHNPALGPYNVKLIEANNAKIAQLKKDVAEVQHKQAQ